MDDDELRNEGQDTVLHLGALTSIKTVNDDERWNRRVANHVEWLNDELLDLHLKRVRKN